jgi:hypothetical protein
LIVETPKDLNTLLLYPFSLEVVYMMAISREVVRFGFYWCNTTVAKPEDHGKAIQQ